MFHIRWHKLFNFALSREYAKESLKNVEPILKQVLADTRENHFDHLGKYKGIPIISSQFYSCIDEPKLPLPERAKFLLHHFEVSKVSPKLAGSYTEDKFKNGTLLQEDHEQHEEDNVSFSVCSQTEYHMSQTVEETRMGIALGSGGKDHFNLYDIAYPGFQAAIDICKTPEDAQRLNDVLNSFVFKTIAERGNHTMNKEGMSFFGEDITNRAAVGSRHKFAYERRRKKK